MKRLLANMVLPLSLFAALASAGETSPLVGVWSGVMTHKGEPMAVSIEFKAGARLGMVFDVPDMNLHQVGPFPVKESSGGASAYLFSFTFGKDPQSLAGRWSFDGHDITFDLKKGPLPAREPPAEAVVPIGIPAWTFKTGGAIWSSPTTDDRHVYFGSSDGILYALDLVSGEPSWHFKTDRPIVAGPTVSKADIYVASDDGFLYKLSTDKGTLRWRFDTHGGSVRRVLPIPTEDATYDVYGSAPTIAGGVVYVGSADGALYAVDAGSGQERWHFPTGDIVRSTPTVANGRVFFGSRDHKVYCLDASTGAVIWSHDAVREVVSSPLVSGGAVYIGSRSSDFLALDEATGNVRWSFFYWSSWVESSARTKDSILYVGSSDYQQLFAIRAGDGGKVWAFGTGGSAWPTPWVTEDTVFMGTVGILNYYLIDHKGGFFAVDRKTGKARWRYPFSPIPGMVVYGVSSSAQSAAGRVYFGGLDGTFYAFPVAGR